jgi:hypothetical protein
VNFEAENNSLARQGWVDCHDVHAKKCFLK